MLPQQRRSGSIVGRGNEEEPKKQTQDLKEKLREETFFDEHKNKAATKEKKEKKKNKKQKEQDRDTDTFHYLYTEVFYPKSGKTHRRYMRVNDRTKQLTFVSVHNVPDVSQAQPHAKLATKEITVRESSSANKRYTDDDIVGYRQIKVRGKNNKLRPYTQAVTKDGKLLICSTKSAEESGKRILNREESDREWLITSSLQQKDDEAVREHQLNLRREYKDGKKKLRLAAEESHKVRKGQKRIQRKSNTASGRKGKRDEEEEEEDREEKGHHPPLSDYKYYDRDCDDDDDDGDFADDNDEKERRADLEEEEVKSSIGIITKPPKTNPRKLLPNTRVRHSSNSVRVKMQKMNGDEEYDVPLLQHTRGRRSAPRLAWEETPPPQQKRRSNSRVRRIGSRPLQQQKPAPPFPSPKEEFSASLPPSHAHAFPVTSATSSGSKMRGLNGNGNGKEQNNSTRHHCRKEGAAREGGTLAIVFRQKK